MRAADERYSSFDKKFIMQKLFPNKDFKLDY